MTACLFITTISQTSAQMTILAVYYFPILFMKKMGAIYVFIIYNVVLKGKTVGFPKNSCSLFCKISV